jgi:hypothetical protein
MKNRMLAVVCMALFSCGNQNNNGDAATLDGTKTNAAANDSTSHPDGMTNGSVISTDTAAMKPLVDTQHR